MWQFGEEIMQGICERRLSSGFDHIRIHYTAIAQKDPDWVKKHALHYGGVDTAGWRREMEIDYNAYGGQRIWPMLNPKYHQQELADTGTHTLFRVIDQGIRHPTVCIWVAVNRRGDRHIYREYYSTGRSIGMNCREILALTPQGEEVAHNFIDPSTRKRGAETLTPIIRVYETNGLPCIAADNSFAGYDAVTSGLLSALARYALRTGEMPDPIASLEPNQEQLLVLAAKPALTFDPRFAGRTFLQCQNHRWQELKGDASQKAPREKPMDKDDDGPDCVRYAMQSGLYYSSKKSSDIRVITFGTILRSKRKDRPSEATEKIYDRARCYG